MVVVVVVSRKDPKGPLFFSPSSKRDGRNEGRGIGVLEEHKGENNRRASTPCVGNLSDLPSFGSFRGSVLTGPLLTGTK